MNVDITNRGPVAVAAVSGDFDLGDHVALGDTIQPLVSEPDSRVAVDLSGLNQINSQGLSQLISLVIRSRMNRSRVVLVSPTPFVAGVMEVTRLNDWFDIAPDVDTAQRMLTD